MTFRWRAHNVPLGPLIVVFAWNVSPLKKKKKKNLVKVPNFLDPRMLIKALEIIMHVWSLK